MTDEIKEILDIFKQVDLETDVGGCSNCPRKDKNKTCIGCLNNAKDKLLDYITNLQESHCEYKEKCNEYNVGCIKEILCNYQKTNNNLQQRIDTATDYLLDKYVRGLLGDNEVNNVVKILRGDE